MSALVKTLALLALALLMAMAALLVPAHVRSVDPDVLRYAGSQGPSLEASIRSELEAARLGPAGRLAEIAPLAKNFQEALRVREQELLAVKPEYSLSGGPDAYFEEFLELVQRDQAGQTADNGVLSVLLPRNERKVLVEQLTESRNSHVAALLQARDIGGLVRLHPASHPAGAPYDAGILTLASLIHGGHFPVDTAARIGRIAEAALNGNPSAVRELENLVIHTLSIARQLDFISLASIAETITELDAWSRTATLFRTHPGRIPMLYGTIRFSGSPQKVHDYLLQHPDHGLSDLRHAAREGESAVNYLLAQDQPVYRASGSIASLTALLAPYRPEFAVRLTYTSSSTGLWLKAAILFMAGLCFAWAMGAAWRGSFRSKDATVSRLNPAVFARDAFISIVFLLVVWIFAEPMILKSEEPVTDNSPRIEFAGNIGLDSLKSPVRIMQELNQVTLLVLALFFIVQLVIYCFCLIKIREVAKQKLNAETKLKLLENEEQLFDFGLYVGLGGTVLSLILVAIGIVEASLMAAYASTLFGILFVALLKVLNLRPYRRKLILEAGRGTAPSTAALMKDIEL